MNFIPPPTKGIESVIASSTNFRSFCWLVFAIIAIAPVSADEPYIPDELEPWREWVLFDHPELNCPIDAQSGLQLQCAWVNSLSVNVNRQPVASGANFRMSVHVYADSQVPLPVAGRYQPTNVIVQQPSGTDILVTGTPKQPLVSLVPGRYEISGSFTWSDEPSFITVPSGTAQTALSVDSERQSKPVLQNNKLWLSRRTASEEDNTLEIRVFRELRDTTPQLLRTHIKLTVAGFQRVVDLGNVIPSGFVRTSTTSALPNRFDEEERLLVNLRRGEHSLIVNARATTLLNEFQPTQPEHPAWPSQEIWGVRDYTSERTVTISGGEPVDLSTVGAPFRQSKGFVLNTSDTLQLIEKERGDSSEDVGDFRIKRAMWLSFDGDSLTSKDVVESEIDHETRVVADYLPGKISVDSVPRLVTQADSDDVESAGVKLNVRKSKIEAVSEIGEWHEMSASGWNVDAFSLSATLNLPPGWRLLWTTGIDRVSHSWLSQWRLWDIFLVLLLVGLIARTHGFIWAGIAGVTVLLSYQDSAAPTVGWLILIAITYLGRVIDSDKLDRWLRPIYWVVLIPVVAVAVLFAGINAQQAIFLQLETPKSPSHARISSNLGDVIFDQALRKPSDTQEKLTAKVQRRNQDTESAGVEEVAVVGSFLKRDSFDLPEIELADTLAADFVDSTHFASGLAIPTGPGTPTWNWHTVDLQWSGPVTKDQMMSLTVLSPWWSRILYVVTAVLVLVVSAFFAILQLPDKEQISRVMKSMTPLLLVTLIFPVGQDINAQPIHPDILEELEDRLTKKPDCLPYCASIEKVDIQINGDQLSTKLRVHVGDDLAVPIVELSDNLQPQSIAVVGQTNSTNVQKGGVLYTFLVTGRHDVEFSVDLTSVLQLKLKFPIDPTTIDVARGGWTVDGIHDGVLTGDALAFNRLKDDSGTEVLASEWAGESPVEPHVHVRRNLVLGMIPMVYTQVTRRQPSSGEFSITIPLVDGETVLTESMQVGGGQVTVTFGPNTNNVRWSSQLNLGSELRLVAPDISQWVEVWTVRGSDHWDYTAEGTPPVKTSGATAAFQPRSDEVLLLRLERPKSIEGQTLTVEAADLETEVGARSYTGTLKLSLQASRGGEFHVKLPQEATIKRITIQGNEQPTPTGDSITLSIPPGKSISVVEWTQDTSIGMLFNSPKIDLSQPARNVDLTVRFPESRWTLFLGGPALGAAVTVWGVIAVILTIAVLLSRLSRFPLSTTDAVLLSAGATFANLWALLLVGIWMIGIWWRSNRELPKMSVDVYRLLQVTFVVASVVAVASLIYTIPLALFGQPEMQVEGYGSTGYSYRWFDDGSGSIFPTAWVLSLPNWIYLLVMLAWSLWLVLAIVRWVQTAWRALSRFGFWMPDTDLIQTKTQESRVDAEPASDSPEPQKT